MSKVKSKDAKSEIFLGKQLWKLGVRYRKNNNSLYGCPDFSITKSRVVIFVDGEFWHGHNWEIKREKIKNNRHYWIKKIERNMKRDLVVNTYYLSQHWLVIRLWEKRLKTGTDEIAEIIYNILNERTLLDSHRWRSELIML